MVFDKWKTLNQWKRIIILQGRKLNKTKINSIRFDYQMGIETITIQHPKFISVADITVHLQALLSSLLCYAQLKKLFILCQ